MVKSTYNGRAPLAFSQQRLWYLSKIEPSSSVFNLARVYSLTGSLNEDALRRAFLMLAQRHEILRTSIQTDEGIPYQCIHDEYPIKLRIVSAAQLSTITELVDAEANHCFDLEQAPLWRVLLIRCENNKYMLSMVFQHIIFDGKSAEIISRELASLYSSCCQGQVSCVEKLSIQFPDFALWQNKRLDNNEYDQQLRYWVKQYPQELPVLELPCDYKRPALQSFDGSSESLRISRASVDRLVDIGKQNSASVFMVMLSAFYALMNRLSGANTIIVGMPVAGRMHPELDNVVGFFANTLALPLDVLPEETFSQLLKKVRDRCLSALENQELPFELLVRELNPLRDVSRTPVFQCVFAYEKKAKEKLKLSGLDVEEVQSNTSRVQTDIGFWLSDDEDGIKLVLEYCTGLFCAATAARFLSYYVNIINGVIEDSEQAVSAFNLLSDEEQSCLNGFNKTDRVFKHQTVFPRWFSQQAEIYKNKTAVVEGFGKDSISKVISYAELDHRSSGSPSDCLTAA